LAFLERKWNRPAMTERDANANDLLDFLDLAAMKAGRPTFPELLPLKPAGDNSKRLACTQTGPGRIPSPDARLTRMERASVRVSGKRGGIDVEVRTVGGKTPAVAVELREGRKIVTHHDLGLVGPHGQSALLSVHHELPSPGSYEVLLTADGREVARRKL
jgi:hypothetical protein